MVDRTQFEYIQSINATKKTACFYPMDETSGDAIDAFNYGPDLEVNDNSQWTDNTGWLSGDGVADFAGFHSDGTAGEEEQTANLFQINNGTQLVAYQIAYTSAPVSAEVYLAMGGQDASPSNSRSGIEHSLATDGDTRQMTTTDANVKRFFPFGGGFDATDFNDVMTVVWINDCRDGLTDNGTGRCNTYACEDGDGLNLASSSGKVDENEYNSNHFGKFLGYPSGMTSGTGLFLGARSNEFDTQREDIVPFEIRRLVGMNFGSNTPKN